MAAALANLARMTTATTGTGTITLGSAVPGFLTFAEAGISDGQELSYAIEDGLEREVGRGVYSSSGTTLTRDVLNSTNSGAEINLSGNAQVFITALKEDFDNIARTSEAQTFAKPQRVGLKTLTYGSTVTIDLNDGNAFELTMSGNPTIANPSNMASAIGQEVFVVFRGAYQPAFGSYWKFPGGAVPDFSGSLNVVGGVVVSSTEIAAFAGAGMA